MSRLGLGISGNKIVPRKTESTEQMGTGVFPTEFRLFRETENSRNSVLLNKNISNSRNSVPNPSAEEKTTRNSVPWKEHIKKKALGMAFRGRENNSEQNTAAENFKNVSYIYLRYFVVFSVADPDPGSGAFLTPGSGIGFFRIRLSFVQFVDTKMV